MEDLVHIAEYRHKVQAQGAGLTAQSSVEMEKVKGEPGTRNQKPETRNKEQ